FGFWILDFGFVVRLLQNPKSKIQNPKFTRIAVVAGLLLLFTLPNLWVDGAAAAENGRYLAGKGLPSGQTAEWQSYLAACRWLGSNAPPGSMVMARMGTLMSVYAPQSSIVIPLIPPDKYPDYIGRYKVDYVL